MTQLFTARLWQEGAWIVAQCLEVDLASQGETEEKALDNLREALELHFQPPRATATLRAGHIQARIGAT
jgi:predicted RNase H-like HicB family nuclease